MKNYSIKAPRLIGITRVNVGTMWIAFAQYTPGANDRIGGYLRHIGTVAAPAKYVSRFHR